MVIYLNGRNQILKLEELFEGTLSTSAVYPREVVKRALDNNAAAIAITKKLKEATQSIDVSVHDHLIIAGNDVYSFADHGIL